MSTNPRRGAPCRLCGEPKTSSGPLPCRRCSGVGSRSAPRECQVCSSSYQPSHTLQRTCSRTCGAFLRTGGKPKASEVSWLQCEECYAWHTHAGGPRCDCAAQLMARALAGPKVYAYRCLDCQQAALATIPGGRRGSGPRPKFCDQCKQTRRLAANRDERRRRRAKLRGAQTEPVNTRRVYERDGWQCGICDEPVDRDLEYPHPRSASLDHVLPLALGGAHSMANVQLAHLECNHAKGATPPPAAPLPPSKVQEAEPPEPRVLCGPRWCALAYVEAAR